MASIHRADARTMVETRTGDGKILMTRTFQLSRDGKWLTISSHYPANGSTFVIRSRRASYGAADK
jgi:hypothetical protein